MGKIKDLTIQLERNKPYFAGELIVGEVTFNLTSRLAISHILLTFEGVGICKNGVHFKESIYFYEVTLFSSGQDHQIGPHKYPFNIPLPDKLPTSVKMDNASIKYKIKVKLKCKSSIKKSLKRQIMITEVIDANVFNPQPVATLHKVSTLFSNSQKIKNKDLLISPKRSIYCAEEQIEINIQYKDHIPRYMGTIKARLNRYVLFNPKANKHRFSVKKQIKELSDNTSEKTAERTLLIPVPNSVMPTNTLTNAVQVKYVLHVKIPGYLEHKIPIIIGTRSYTDACSYEELGIGTREQDHDSVIIPSAPIYTDEYEDFDRCDGPQNAMFLCPPDYFPANEFDVPPSYDETVSMRNSSSNENILGAF